MIGTAGENLDVSCIFPSSFPSEIVHLKHCQRFSVIKVRQFSLGHGKLKLTLACQRCGSGRAAAVFFNLPGLLRENAMDLRQIWLYFESFDSIYRISIYQLNICGFNIFTKIIIISEIFNLQKKRVNLQLQISIYREKPSLTVGNFNLPRKIQSGNFNLPNLRTGKLEYHLVNWKLPTSLVNCNIVW